MANAIVRYPARGQAPEIYAMRLKARQYIEEDGFIDAWKKEGFCTYKRKKSDAYFRISNELFDNNGKLKVYTPEEWSNKLIELDDYEDIPF